MTNPFTIKTKQLQARLKNYAANEFPAMAGRKSLRFVDDNFRNQSWAGLPHIPFNQRSKKQWLKINNAGKAILVQTGTYRRSWLAEAAPGQTRIYSTFKWAKVHNEGFNGTVNQTVKAHQRRITKLGVVGKKELKTKSHIQFGRVDTGNTSSVAAHNRTIEQHIPRRQVAPTKERPSSVLNNIIKKQIQLDYLKILKGKL